MHRIESHRAELYSVARLVVKSRPGDDRRKRLVFTCLVIVFALNGLCAFVLSYKYEKS